jgi:DNA-binding response OmpR family regulator
MFSKKVLVISDNEEIRTSVLANLICCEVVCVKANCQSEAFVTIIKKENPELIILDIMMPDLLGSIMTCLEIRKSWDTPIFMLTVIKPGVFRGLEFDCPGIEFNAEELTKRVKRILLV